jgi:hypothetical protein
VRAARVKIHWPWGSWHLAWIPIEASGI